MKTLKILFTKLKLNHIFRHGCPIMSSIVEILILFEQHKQNLKNSVRQTILQLKELPPELLERPQNLQALKDYISSNDKYGHFVETNASLFVDDLQPAYRLLIEKYAFINM